MSDQVQVFTYHGAKGYRLDRFLVEQLPELSRSRVQGLIRDGFVRVANKVVTKSGLGLEDAQAVEIHIPPPQPSGIIAEEIPLQIIYETRDLMVINKPAGMVVHPAAGHDSGTLVNAALAHAPDIEGIGGEQRPGVVHRLDKETSGLILMAKNDLTHRWLQDQFRLRKVEKIYVALVDGAPPTPSGIVDAPVGRDPSHRKKMAVVPIARGREAVTEYHTLEKFTQHTLIEAHPRTGRTHQIRLHMAFLGCPIVGDTLYGHKRISIPIKRHFLHAARLKITLPGESEPRTFEAPLPPELEAALAHLRGH